MDEAASAARAAALERARAAAREGARRLPGILAQQAKAAQHRRRLAEAIRMSMAAASDEADYDARNKASGGSCTTDLPASDKAGPETKCKDFDCLSSADLAFWDGASLGSPGGGGGMASNQASSAIKRGADGDAAAPNCKTQKKVKVEKNAA